MHVSYEMIAKYRITCIPFHIFILKKKHEWDEEHEKDIKFHAHSLICKKLSPIIYHQLVERARWSAKV